MPSSEKNTLPDLIIIRPASVQAVIRCQHFGTMAAQLPDGNRQADPEKSPDDHYPGTVRIDVFFKGTADEEASGTGSTAIKDAGSPPVAPASYH